MSSFIMTTGRLVRHNYVSFLIFFFMLFRPQIMFWVRHELIRPLFGHGCETGSCKKVSGPATVMEAGLVLSDDDDEGCGDDGGSCSEDNESDEDTGEDYSDDEGCNDDGSCGSEDDSYYTEEEETYEDDGCSCSGETVVTSTDTENSYYNGTLQIKLTIRSSTNYYRLYISDPSGRTAVTIFSRTALGHGTYYFSWDGVYDTDEVTAGGYYKVILETEYAPYVRRERNFYYSSKHGFQVDGTSSNVVEIDM